MESVWDLLTAVGGPLFTIGGTILGILVGAFITRSNEHKQWLRNEKIKLYSEYINTFGTIQYDTIFKAIDEREPNEGLYEYANQIHKLCMRVILVAPLELVNEIQEQMNVILELQAMAGNLPYDMNAKYFRPGQTKAEIRAANEEMIGEIMEILEEKVHGEADAGYKRLHRIANLMRQDLQVAHAVPRTVIDRVLRRPVTGEPPEKQ